MTPSADVFEFLRWWEGLPGGLPALTAYPDGGGVWTIGFGHTHGVQQGDVCTADTAYSLLHEDGLEHAAVVSRLVGMDLHQNQFDALVSFAFNLGGGSLAGSTLLKYVRKMDMLDAALEFPKWVYVGKQPCDGLRKRRMAEAMMFVAGDYTGRP